MEVTIQTADENAKVEIDIATYDFDDETTVSSYQNTTPVQYTGWKVTRGGVTTTDKINGSKSVQMRAYKDNTEYGVLESTIQFENAIRAEFKAKYNQLEAKLKISQSVDGTTWTNETIVTLSNQATQLNHSYTISETGATVYLKFDVAYDTIPTEAVKVTIDDIVIKGYSE